MTTDRTLPGQIIFTENLDSPNFNIDGVVENDKNLLREIDTSNGNITGVTGGIKALDAVGLSQVQKRTMGLLPVLSTLDTPPVNPNVGDRYIVGTGTGIFTDHDNEIAEVVGRGIDYTSVTSGGTILARNDKSIAYAPDKKIYVVVGSDGFSYSYDGIIFIPTTEPSTEAWTKVKYIKEWGKFIACSTLSVTYSFATSTDGKNWTGHVGIFKNYKNLAYFPLEDKVFASASTGSPRLSYSSDGETWSDSGITLTEETWTLIEYSYFHKKLVILNGSSATNQFGYSSNGLDWEYSSPSSGLSWESICSFEDRIITCSLTGSPNRVFYTDDLVNWTAIEVSPSDVNPWKGIDFADGILYMVSAAGAAAYSLDRGDTWTLVTTENTDFRDITYAPDRGEFAAIGRNGTYRSFVTDKITDYLFDVAAEGQHVYDIAAMNDCLFHDNEWKRQFSWIATGTTTCAAGNDTDTIEILSEEVLSSTETLNLETRISATLRGGDGTALIRKCYDVIAYDGELNGTPEDKIETIIGVDGITTLNTSITSNIVSTPTGKIKLTLEHIVSTAPSETTIDWIVDIKGNLHTGVGDYS